MQINSVEYLWLLLLIPFLSVFYLWRKKAKARDLNLLIDRSLQGHIIKNVSYRKIWIKFSMTLGVVLFAVIALAGPRWGIEWQEVKRLGLDIIVALDVSKSMLTEDVKPNRLVAAKREIKKLINVMRSDRIGIVAFAGSAFLQCPLTIDYGTAKLFVDDLDINTITRGGTHIGASIESAIKAYEGHEKKHRVMFLITDGEDHDSKVFDAVKKAKEAGIIIYPIAIGRKEGGPIPIFDENGSRSYLKDDQGQIVISKANQVLLQKIALMTGGRKGSIGQGQFPLDEIYLEEVQKLEKKEIESLRQKRHIHRYQWPLFLAFLLLFFEFILSERKRAIV